MATYVNDLRLTELATGEGSGTWGTTTNTNLELIGEALGYGTQDCFASDADATTTVADGVSDPARAMYFKVTSSATLTATRTLTIAPNTVSRVMLIENATTGSQSISISQGSGGNVTIASGQVKMVYLDGAGSGAAVVDAMASLELGTITVANLTATTADINGGTIDGVTLGTNSAVTEAQIDNININGNTISSTDTNGNVTITPDGTGSVAITKIDVAGGEIDGTAIGANSASTGSFTTLNATGGGALTGTWTDLGSVTTVDINGGTIDGADITVGAGKTLDVSAGTFTVANDQISGDAINGGTATPVTVDATNIQLTNLKAKDGTAAGSIADSTGVVTLASSVLTTTDINGGTIDGVTIGGSSAGAGSFTTLNTSGSVVFNEAGADVDFRVESDTNTTALFLQGSDGNFGVGTGVPEAKLTVRGLPVSESGSTSYGSTLIRGEDYSISNTQRGILDIEMSGLGLQDRGATLTFTNNVSHFGQGLDYVAAGLKAGKESTINTNQSAYLAFYTNSSGTVSERLRISSGGDISFYEDTGTTPKFFWDASAESLGIGTTSPDGKLNVFSASAGSVSADADADELVLENSGNVGLSLLTASTGESGIYFGNPGTNGQKDFYLKFYHESHATTANRRAFTFNTASTERMRIDSDGNVGIGRVPTAVEAAYDSIQLGAGGTFLSGSSNLAAGNFGQNYYVDAAGNTKYLGNDEAERITMNNGYIAFENAPANTSGAGAALTFNERMRIDSAGNVGIGTSSPVSLLHVEGTDDVVTRIKSTGADSLARLILQNDGRTWAIDNDGANSDALTFYDATAVAERMRIDSSGNVGIGTSSPSTELEISASIDPVLRLNNSTNTVTNGADIGEIQFYTNDASVDGVGVKAFVKAVAGSFGANQGSANLTFGTAADDAINASEKMRLDRNGKLGIGTTSPASTLNIIQTSNDLVDGFRADSPTSNSYIALSMDGDDAFVVAGNSGAESTNLRFYTSSSGTEAERARIDSSGNVIIGSGGLDVSGVGGTYTALNMRAGAGYPVLYGQTTATTTNSAAMQIVGATSGASTGGAAELLGVIQIAAESDSSTNATGYINFYTGSGGSTSEAARITSSGHFLVGKTSAGNITDFGGEIRNDGTALFSRSGNSALFLGRGVSTGALASFYYGASVPSSPVGSISTDGTSTAYNTTSDYRLKDVDGPITNSGAYIDALKPVQGSWKEDGSRFIGLIAHEVQEVSETPIATGEKDGEEMQAMDYSSPELIANLIAEIQSLRARVHALESK